jgi:cation diffusion facilitator CzcD-associated flavoprotein CzcO
VDDVEHVLIVGGGIGGLTLAVALHQQGLRVEFVERNPEWHTLGAGLSVQPNGLRVLRQLRLDSAVIDAVVFDLTAPAGPDVFAGPVGAARAGPETRTAVPSAHCFCSAWRMVATSVQVRDPVTSTRRVMPPAWPRSASTSTAGAGSARTW